VAITFGANAGAVSEHVLTLMLAYRRLMLAGRRLREDVWLRQQLRARQVSFDE
jgi:phosphoglycerate dehydrogenase-like enzyme